MPAISAIAWINFAAAVILGLMALGGNIFMISPAIAAAISGCLFLAIDRALTLLTEIRDRLPEPERKDEPAPSRLPGGTPTRTISEIEADLAKVREKAKA